MHSPRTLLLFGAVAVSLACGQPAPHKRVAHAASPPLAPPNSPLPPAAPAISVRDPGGLPASGATLNFYDLDRRATLRTGTTNELGVYEERVTHRPLIVTTLSAEGYAVFPLDQNAPPATIRLSANCIRFSGTYEDESVIPATHDTTLLIYSLAGPVEAPFAARLSAARTFRGCLPEGRYYIDGPLSTVGDAVLFDLPLRTSLRYVGTRPEHAKQSPPPGHPVRLSRGDAAKSVPPGVSLVGLGESNHGTATFTTERLRFTLALAKHRPVRHILLEAGFGETLELDRYVRGEKVDLRPAVAGLRFWMWDTEEFIAAMEELRAHNRSRPRGERIRVLGIDFQSSPAATDFLLKSLGGSLSDTERGFLQLANSPDAATWLAATASDRTNTRMLLERLAVPKNELDSAALAARSLLFRLQLLEEPVFLNRKRLRDTLMAQMTAALVAGRTDGTSIIWAHMEHVSRSFAVGQETMGFFLDDLLGKRYWALVMLGQRGTARAWDQSAKVGVLVHELGASPPHSIESALGHGHAGPDPIYAFFDAQPQPLRKWLGGLRYLRQFGAAFPGDDASWALYDVTRAFDGAVVFDAVHGSTPTPTGDRRAAP